VKYFPAGEAIAGVDREKLVGFDAHEDEELRYHPRLRRVLTTLIRESPLFYGVLHWNEGTDLQEVDRRVRAGVAGPVDFEGAVYAELRTIVCRCCEAQVRVLAVDPGQALFASSLASRLRGHQFQKACPICKCKGELPPHVVEFVGLT
jgi:hypothetical protein